MSFHMGYTSKWHFLFDDGYSRDICPHWSGINFETAFISTGGHGRTAMEPGMACYDSSSSCGLRSTKPWTSSGCSFYWENDDQIPGSTGRASADRRGSARHSGGPFWWTCRTGNTPNGDSTWLRHAKTAAANLEQIMVKWIKLPES